MWFGDAYAWTATIESTKHGPIITTRRAIIERNGPLSTAAPCDTYANPDTTAYTSVTMKVIHAAAIPSFLACGVNVESSGMLECLILESPLPAAQRFDIDLRVGRCRLPPFKCMPCWAVLVSHGFFPKTTGAIDDYHMSNPAWPSDNLLLRCM